MTTTSDTYMGPRRHVAGRRHAGDAYAALSLVDRWLSYIKQPLPELFPGLSDLTVQLFASTLQLEMSTTSLPAGTAYLAGAFLSTIFLLLGQTVVVSRYRGRSGVAYPRAYAEKAEMEANPNAVKFNCAQRAHQNTLENLPMLYTMTLITALKYPSLAAGALGLWSLARVGYTIGYSTGNPNKRTNALSVLHYPILLTMLAASTYTVVQLLAEN
ncbi:hypothetical protein DFH09DRAFT_1138783 [Mycena vulgaris]|nr:hypothetical protein DFH09DRAFT_1138783 [Mycena vulgaris]